MHFPILINIRQGHDSELKQRTFSYCFQPNIQPYLVMYPCLIYRICFYWAMSIECYIIVDEWVCWYMKLLWTTKTVFYSLNRNQLIKYDYNLWINEINWGTLLKSRFMKWYERRGRTLNSQVIGFANIAQLCDSVLVKYWTTNFFYLPASATITLGTLSWFRVLCKFTMFRLWRSFISANFIITDQWCVMYATNALRPHRWVQGNIELSTVSPKRTED